MLLRSVARQSSRLSNRAMTGVGRTLPVPVPRKSADVSGRAARVAPRARRVHVARARSSPRDDAHGRVESRAARFGARLPGFGSRVRVVDVPAGANDTSPRASATTAHGRRVERRVAARARTPPDSRTRLSSSASSSSASSSAPDAAPPRARVLRPPPVARRPGPSRTARHQLERHPHHPGVIDSPRPTAARAVAARRRTDTDVVASASSSSAASAISSSTAVAETGVDVGGPPTPSTTGSTPRALRKPHRLPLLTPPPIVVARPRRRRRVARANDASRRTRGVGATRVARRRPPRDSRRSPRRIAAFAAAATSRTRAVTRDTRDSSPATAKC